MRLGTCIALELAVAAGAVAGVWFGVGQATKLAGTYLTGSAAEAASRSPESGAPRETVATPERLPRAYLAVAPRPIENVFGAPDGELLAPLGASKVTHVKLNHGGTSLSLRVDFASGARAAFKPEQTHPQSDPRREIAAFRIDRLLGIGHVPPAKATSIPVQDLVDAAEPGYRTYIAGRLEDEGIARDGMLHGELSWWIPEIRLAKIGPFKVDDPEGKDLWSEYLTVGAKPPAEQRPMLAQLASVILFDVLIDNPDRWTGSNTEMSVDGQTLYFMDNTLSFSIFGLGHEQNLGALHRISVFPRRLVERMRALTEDQIVEALRMGAEDGLGPLLNPSEVRAILVRRDHMIAYIDDLTAQFGADAVLSLP